MHRLLVVIVNYRTPALVIDCLRSLAGEVKSIPAEVIVVDNASGDKSLDDINAAVEQAGYQDWCRTIQSDENGGFAYANNLAIREAFKSRQKPHFVMLLNPDTIVRSGALDGLVEFMDRHPEVGICGSQMENPDGSLATSSFRMPTPLGQFVHATRFGPLFRLFERQVVNLPIRSENVECDWVSGAALLARAEVFAQIGLMDDGYFLYFEETDFCWRAKNAGWQVWLVPQSRIVHLVGETTGVSKGGPNRRPAYWYDSRRRLFVKCYGVLGLIAADLFWLIGRLSFNLRRLLRLGGGRQQEDPKWFTYDLISGDLRALIDGSVFRIERHPGAPSVDSRA